MGNFFSQVNSERELERSGDAFSEEYRYPTKSGPYFGGHFIMGGERFETCQPEVYLFGENTDLNFLGSKPLPFPYSNPLSNEPSRTLRALINIRKETLRLVKVDLTRLPQESQPIDSYDDLEKEEKPSLYNIEFVFDSDVKCSITIHYLATEDITSNGVFYKPRKDAYSSPSFIYPQGADQSFSQPSHIFDPSIFSGNDLIYRAFDDQGFFDPSVPFPVIIQCTAMEGDEPRQSHSLIAVVEKNHEFHYSIKPFKQKNFIDGLTYLMQEIYGIENKNVRDTRRDKNSPLPSEDEIEDNGYECVICMSETRDTMILPCKHLCLCNACADSLRYQANNCPICRSPFRALLQLKAVCQSTEPPIPSNLRIACASPALANSQHEVNSPGSRPINVTTGDSVSMPIGYQPIPLIEALNGPCPMPSTTFRGMYSFRQTDCKPKISNAAVTAVVVPASGKRMTRSGSSGSFVSSKRGAGQLDLGMERITIDKEPSQSEKDVSMRGSKFSSFGSCDIECNQYPSIERVHQKQKSFDENGPSNSDIYDLDLLKCLPNQERRSTINLSEYKVTHKSVDVDEKVLSNSSASTQRRHTLSRSSIKKEEMGTKEKRRSGVGTHPESSSCSSSSASSIDPLIPDEILIGKHSDSESPGGLVSSDKSVSSSKKSVSSLTTSYSQEGRFDSCNESHSIINQDKP